MQLENRSIAKCVILSIITCGIYGIVWGVKIARDAVKVKDVNDDGLAEILLVLFLPFIGFFLAERKLNEGCNAAGAITQSSTLFSDFSAWVLLTTA